MSDIDAPMRYAEPMTDRTSRDGSITLVVLLALALAVAAVGLAILSREVAEPFVLAILAALAVVGLGAKLVGFEDLLDLLLAQVGVESLDKLSQALVAS